MSKLQGYIDDLTNKRKILTKGEFVELSPGATKEILEILVKHKEAIEQLEQSQAERKKLTEIIARNLVAWDTSKDKREGLLPEVYLSNKVMYKQLTGEEYRMHKAIEKFRIGEM